MHVTYAKQNIRDLCLFLHTTYVFFWRTVGVHRAFFGGGAVLDVQGYSGGVVLGPFVEAAACEKEKRFVGLEGGVV